MKKIYTVLSLSVCIILLQSGVKGVNYSSTPPQGYTGATGTYCTNCHSDFSLNSGGGNVVVTGLPAGGYVPGTTYPLSITITHSAADRQKWGFSMKAVKSGGSSVGTFSTTNTNVATNGVELSHGNNGAASTAPTNTYTYSNLSWKAPAGTTTGNVTFYYVGNAADGTGGSNNDYIYAGSTVVSLPIELNSFTALTDNNNVILKWQTASEINSNYFDVERSDDGQFFFSIGKVNATGNSSQPVSYNFTDTKLSSNNGSQIFYRLRLVDKDGTARYSNNISIKPIITGVIIKNIYPTLVRKNELITVDILSDKARMMNIVVMDESGRNLQYITANLATGSNTIKFVPKVDNLKGMLFVKFESTNFQQTKSLILQ